MATKVTLAGKELGTVDLLDLTMGEAMQLEDRTGFTIVELEQQLVRGSARAVQALVWLVKVKNGDPGAELHAEFRFKDLQTEQVGADPTSAADQVAELEKAFEVDGTPTSAS